MQITFEAAHHFALTVRDSEASAAFYAIFGFKVTLRWAAQDGSLVIVQLSRGDGFILEMFQYEANKERPPARLAIGNDLDEVGVKHIAFRVADVDAAHAELGATQCGELTGVQQGRTGIEYFFIADPDGNWVEIVQDDRRLDPGNPVSLIS